MQTYAAIIGIGVTITLVILALGITALMCVAMWRLFRKAGLPGWAIFVPGYNMWVYYKMCWKKMWPFWSVLGCIVGSFVLSFVPIYLMYIYGYTLYYRALSVTRMLSLLIVVYVWVLSILTYVRMARAFGKGGGFAVGLIFLSPIFVPILAFGSAEYIGPEGVRD